jgi:SAM-dependent methyltransferase
VIQLADDFFSSFTGYGMKEYYARRAQNYESIYQKTELQSEIDWVVERASEVVVARHVLEVACGTGFWTQRLAPFADSVTATDNCEEMLAVAKAKTYKDENVEFALADAFDLPAGEFNACIAAFWWSHIKKEQQVSFLTKLRARLGKDSVLVLIDDNYLEERTLPTARTDLEGNTFQLRDCDDGSRFEILKNYPADSYLRKKFAPFAKEIRIQRSEHYWMLTCVLR